MDPVPITDLWFRTEQGLEEIARGLALEEIESGEDETWSWVIGTYVDDRIQITRKRGVLAGETDTFLFYWGEAKSFSRAVSFTIVSRLNENGIIKVFMGRCQPRQDGGLDREVVHTCFAPHLA